MEISKAKAYLELKNKYAPSRAQNGSHSRPAEASFLMCKNQQILDDLMKRKSSTCKYKEPSAMRIENPQSATSHSKSSDTEGIRKENITLVKNIHRRIGAQKEDEPMQMPEEKLELDDFLSALKVKYAHQPTFLQAVEEVANSLEPLFADANPERGDFFKRSFLLLTEPERIVSFRVNWTDDHGNLQTNRGWRVEFSSALGPYQGGIRFHPSVDEDALKFLGFEQTLKNALAGVPLGGGQGGSDFDPKGKSEAEVRRFCDVFMVELNRYLDPQMGIAAGHIGDDNRDLGYLYAQYKSVPKESARALKGTPLLLGRICPEAAGFGVVHIAKYAIEKSGNDLNGARCAVSGSGNVAQYVTKKLIELGGKVVSLSDSNGTLTFENGMTASEWKIVFEVKQASQARLSSLLIMSKTGGQYIPNHSPWRIRDLKADYAFPCATENEINGQAASRLISNGIKGIIEGANLPTTQCGQKVFREHGVLYIPSKAANAGGIAVSTFELAQNSQYLTWEQIDVDRELKETMHNIYDEIDTVSRNSECTLEDAANRVGFLKVVEAMKCLGWIW